MAAHQAPPSLGFSRQEHWSGLPFPSPMHESEKWKWSRLVMSAPQRPHGLQPSRLLHPWDFTGKRIGVGCYCLLRKRCSTWLKGETQTKTTMKYHLTPVKMAIINKSTNNKCWRECGEKGALLYCWWECKCSPLWRTIQRFLKKKKQTRNKTTIWPSNPTWENHNSKRHMYRSGHCSTIYNS